MQTGYVIQVPRRRFEEPTLAVVDWAIDLPPEPVIPTVEVREFKPVHVDGEVYVYGENYNSPRDQMRREALVNGRPCRVAPYRSVLS